MKLRFTIATVALLSVLGLTLVTFLTHGLQEGAANAQLVDTPLPFQESVPASANVAPPSLAPAENSYGGSTVAAGSSNNRWQSQPHRNLSIASTQPIVIRTKNGPQLSGEPVNLNALQFKTIFGVVSIPINAISGLRMPDEVGKSATICLSNGDSVTGVLETESVTIKTAWGGATIGRDHITSIVTTSEPVNWQLQQGRWTMSVTETEEDRSEAETGDSQADDRDGTGLPVLDFESAPAADTVNPLTPPNTSVD